jgi:hypothetical protein
MEVAAGLEPAKTGFADQRLDLFGIATKSVLPRIWCALRVPTLADCASFTGSITTENKQLVCLQYASKSDSHPGHQFCSEQTLDLLRRFRSGRIHAAPFQHCLAIDVVPVA